MMVMPSSPSLFELVLLQMTFTRAFCFANETKELGETHRNPKTFWFWELQGFKVQQDSLGKRLLQAGAGPKGKNHLFVQAFFPNAHSTASLHITSMPKRQFYPSSVFPCWTLTTQTFPRVTFWLSNTGDGSWFQGTFLKAAKKEPTTGYVDSK